MKEWIVLGDDGLAGGGVRRDEDVLVLLEVGDGLLLKVVQPARTTQY